MKHTILVTGGAGFIGSHLVDRLLRESHRVVVLDRMSYAAKREHLPPEGDRFRLYRGDIADRNLVRSILAVEQPLTLYHLAAETHVARAIDTAGEFIHTNVQGTFVLLDECVPYYQRYYDQRGHHWFRFIHISTDEVYGSLTESELPWSLSSPYSPNNPYSASKAASDHLVRAWYRTHALPTIITHAANNYGPRQHVEKLIPMVIRAAALGEAITIHGDGEHVRDWLHVDDHVEGLVRLLSHGQTGQTYNFPGFCERSTNQIIALLTRQLHGKIQFHGHRTEYVVDRPGNDRRYAMQPTLGLRWDPGPTIEFRIDKVIDWYLAQLGRP